MKYNGFTYLGILTWIWPKWFCRRGMHLWDECYSPTGDEMKDHTLFCDACGKTVYFHAVEDDGVVTPDIPWPTRLWWDIKRLYYHLRDMDEPDY